MTRPTLMKPSDFFKGALGRTVAVRLADGGLARGSLLTLDGSLNLVLEAASLEGKPFKRLLVRGNNVSFLGVESIID